MNVLMTGVPVSQAMLTPTFSRSEDSSGTMMSERSPVSGSSVGSAAWHMGEIPEGVKHA